MNLTINGETRDVGDVETVADLLIQLSLDARQVVVELNEGIVRRDRVGDTPLSDRDRIEILRFVGGG